MNKCFTRLMLGLIAAATSLASCEKVSSLNDSANIEQISVVSTDPSEVMLDTPVIDGHNISLPLVYGKYLFPIKVTFDLQVEASCVQILGFDEGGGYTFIFDNIHHIREFYTVAVSGATTRWKIQIVDANTSESAEVLRASGSAPEDSEIQIAPAAITNKVEATVTFQGLGTAVYPMTVIPQIMLAEGASFTEQMPQTLTFEDAKAKKEFTVKAASGRTKTWTFNTKFVAPTDNSSSLTEDQQQRLNIDAEKIAFAGNGVSMVSKNTRFNVSGVGGKVDLIVAPEGKDKLEFPLLATISLPVAPNSFLFNTPENNQYVFANISEQKQVWVADKLTGMIKCWTIALSPEMKTEILTFKLKSFTSKIPTMTVDEANIEIDSRNSRIVIPIDNGLGTAIAEKDNITFQPTFELTVSEGAKCSTTSTLHTYITHNGTLNVETLNGLNKRSWLVFLKDKNAALSSDKSLSNFFIVEYSSKDNRMVLYTTIIVADNDSKTATLDIRAGLDAFPLIISKKTFKANHYATTIVEPEMADYDTPLVFESLESVKEFTVKAGDGTTDNWKIDLKTPLTGKTAEITDFLVTKISNGAIPNDIQIDAQKRRITLVVEAVPPFHITTSITTKDNATVTGTQNNMLSFDSYNQTHQLIVTSQDGSVSNIWTVGIAPPEKIQIANSEFEEWGEFRGVNSGTYTIDPTPGAGYGWGTANLELFGIGVIGTKSVERADKTLAAEMTTAEQNTIFKGIIMAAGTLYTGIFNLNMNYITEPRKMTKFGIPYTARPASFDMEIKYAPGSQLKQATVDATGMYSISNIDGVDKGHVWIELLRWTGPGAIDYDGNPSENITVIGRVELVIDGANNPYTEWTKINLPLVYNPQYDELKPTHLAVVMSSSKDGDKFIGATGSKLSADKFVINY